MRAFLAGLIDRASRALPDLRTLASRLRPFRTAQHLLHRKELAETGRHYRELGVRKRWYSMVNHAEVSGRATDVACLDRDDGVEELRRDPRFGALAEPLRTGLEEWPEKGYLVAEGLIDRERVAEINAETDRLINGGHLHEHHRSPRFMNVHEKSEVVAGVLAEPRVEMLLELILGRSARLFQSITFIQGSQQEAHSDAFHMMTEPPGFLVGVWIALEDIGPDSGPVFYLPGSHRLPYVMSEDLSYPDPPPLLVADKGDSYVLRMREEAESYGTEAKHFTARAGDVLFWHHNLLHGGSGIGRPGSTRRSLVAHYFATDVLCYHEVTERPAIIPAAAGMS